MWTRDMRGVLRDGKTEIAGRMHALDAPQEEIARSGGGRMQAHTDREAVHAEAR